MGALIDGLSPSRRSDLLFESDAKVTFRDSDIYINSDEDGKITVTADSSEADAIEFSGKTSVTGDTTITGTTTVVGAMTNRLSTKDGSTSFTVEDSETFPVHKLDSKGNHQMKGGVKRV